MTMTEAVENLYVEMSKDNNKKDVLEFYEVISCDSNKRNRFKTWCYSIIAYKFAPLIQYAQGEELDKWTLAHIEKYQMKASALEQRNKEIFLILKETAELYVKYMASRKNMRHGEITYLILDECYRREQEGIRNRFTDLQEYIYNIHYSIPGAYKRFIDRGYYCGWFGNQEYLHNANGNFILNKKGHERLLILKSKFE